MSPLSTHLGAALALLCLAAPALDETRLVTIRALDGTPLGPVVAALSAEHRLALRCGPRLGSRRLFLLAERRPLGEVLSQVRGFTREAPGKVGLFRDREGWVLEEDAATTSARQRQVSKWRRRTASYRRARLVEAERFARPHRGDDQNMAAARRRLAQCLGILSGMPRAAQNAALQGQTVACPYARLGLRGQLAVEEAVRGSGASASRPDGTVAWDFDGDRDYTRATAVVRPSGTPAKPGVTLEIMDRDRSVLRYRDLLHHPAWSPEEGWDWTTPHRPYRDRPRGPADAEQIDALQGRVTLREGADWTLDRALDAVASLTHTPILGEYDPCHVDPTANRNPARVKLQPGEVKDQPLFVALETICRRFDLEWQHSAGWVLIRSPRTVQFWAGQLELLPRGSVAGPAGAVGSQIR